MDLAERLISKIRTSPGRAPVGSKLMLLRVLTGALPLEEVLHSLTMRDRRALLHERGPRLSLDQVQLFLKNVRPHARDEAIAVGVLLRRLCVLGQASERRTHTLRWLVDAAPLWMRCYGPVLCDRVLAACVERLPDQATV